MRVRHSFLDSGFYWRSPLVSRPIKTQKREAAHSATSLFWVLIGAGKTYQFSTKGFAFLKY
jgi:hypothetical protein